MRHGVFKGRVNSNWPSRKEDIGTCKVKLNILTGEAEIESDPNHPDDHRQAMEAIKAQPKVAPQAESVPLSEGVAVYKRSLHGHSQETIDDYMFAVEWFERSVGPQTPIAAIIREMAVQWKSELIEHYTGRAFCRRQTIRASLP